MSIMKSGPGNRISVSGITWWACVFIGCFAYAWFVAVSNGHNSIVPATVAMSAFYAAAHIAGYRSGRTIGYAEGVTDTLPRS